MVAYRAQAARARVSAMRLPNSAAGLAATPPRLGRGEQMAAAPAPSPWPERTGDSTWAAWTCPGWESPGCPRSPGYAPAPASGSCSVCSSHCAGRPWTRAALRSGLVTHAHLAHPHPDTHSRSHAIHTPRTGPPETALTRFTNATLNGCVQLHTWMAGHAIPGTHRRTQSPQLHSA